MKSFTRITHLNLLAYILLFYTCYWLIDWLIIPESNILAIFRTRTSSLIYKKYNFWSPWSMECCVGMKNLIFCCDYNVPTLFQNLQKRSLCEGSMAFSKHVTHYGSWSGFPVPIRDRIWKRPCDNLYMVIKRLIVCCGSTH